MLICVSQHQMTQSDMKSHTQHKSTDRNCRVALGTVSLGVCGVSYHELGKPVVYLKKDHEKVTFLSSKYAIHRTRENIK